MIKLVRAAAAALLAAQALVAHAAVTGMTYVSTPGDYIGGGQSQTFEAPDANIGARGTPGAVHASVTDSSNWWYIDFASPIDRKLKRGAYPDATRYPFQSPMGNGLSMSGNGRGCNTLKGWFRVLEYEIGNDGVVTKLAVDFVQNCEVTGPPLYGAIRINSDHPLKVPERAAVAGSDFDVVAGEKANLDGTQSFSRRHAPLSYQWTQVAGPAVILDNPSSPAPAFTAPDVGLDGDTLRFRLDTTDAVGKTSHDEVNVLVENPGARRTEISFSGDPGDWITQGFSYRFNEHNAVIEFSRNYDGGVSAWIQAGDWWNFDSATPVGTPFTPGAYPKATRFPFQNDESPGLNLSGAGRGCNTLTGKFTVYQARFDDQGNPKKVSLKFVQHCEGGLAAARGQVLLNAVPPDVLAAQFRAARRRFGED